LINLPNILTLSNLFCGILAIILVMNDLPKQAVYFVLLAGLFDFFDGFAARALKISGKFGAELDSLADMVTFGVFPGVLLYHILEEQFYLEEVSALFYKIPVLALPTLLFPLCAALRLAKFNISDDQSYYFKGLATPAATLFVCGIPFYEGLNYLVFAEQYVIYFWTICLSLLMVSNYKLIAFKFKDYSIQNNLLKYLLIVFSCILLILFQLKALPTIIILYLIISFINFRVLKNQY